MTSPNSDKRDGFIRGYYGIPDAKKLRSLSFIELAELLSSCEKGTTKYTVVEREVFRRKSRDQIWSTIVGALIGGVCTLVGAYIAVTYSPAQMVQVHCESTTAQAQKEVPSIRNAERQGTQAPKP